MAKDIKLPRLGQSMEEGTIVEWLVKIGDLVSPGDVILQVETDKAAIEMESPIGGYVKDFLVELGATIPVETPLLVIGDKDEEISQDYIDELSAAIPARAAATSATAEHGKHVFASPLAHELAEKLHVDLEEIAPSEGTARINESDVRHAADHDPVGVRLGQTIPLTRLQRITAQRMLHSKQHIPCFYLNAKVDVTELFEMREQLNSSSDVNITFNDFLIRATAIALQRYTIMTGQLGGDCIKLADTIGVALAIAREDGVLSPTIRDADKITLQQTSEYREQLIEKTKTNKLTLEDLEGACITISNLGAFGVESFIPIVVPGQCSIIGVGKIVDTCVPSRKSIDVRKIMALTLSVDHKVANGAYAAQFLDFIKKTLENPKSID